MHAVIALELGVVGERGDSGPAVRGVVGVEVVGLVIQREIEEIAGGLAGAAHVGSYAIGAEALGKVVETAGGGGINQGKGLGAIGGRTLLVEVDGDMRNQRLPLGLDEQLRVVKAADR